MALQKKIHITVVDVMVHWISQPTIGGFDLLSPVLVMIAQVDDESFSLK